MFLLPSYSPELNPDELLNHDVKANAVGRKRARTNSEMMANVRGHLRCRQPQPHVVQRFFMKICRLCSLEKCSLFDALSSK
ncbi:MAG: hypothetical protein HC768_05925 [Acaryochloris sp. CRU_2_0]|nr:hypothetical protein [Acaryochloris sp. CRU_2_0]